MMNVTEAATYLDLPPLITRTGDWAITRESVVCLSQQYQIGLDRLDEDDWVAHMEEKEWVDMGDFEHIFRLAKRMRELEMI